MARGILLKIALCGSTSLLGVLPVLGGTAAASDISAAPPSLNFELHERCQKAFEIAFTDNARDVARQESEEILKALGEENGLSANRPILDCVATLAEFAEHGPKKAVAYWKSISRRAS